MSTDRAALSKLIPYAFRDAFSEPEQLLSAYFHESSVGLCILDTEFRFLAINPALAQMNGIPAAAHLGKTCREVLRDFADKVEPEFRRILETGQPLVGLELSGILPNRSEVGYWIENYFPIKDASGKVKQIGVVVMEITEQKKLEESLRLAAKGMRQEKARLQALRDIDNMLLASLDLDRVLPFISRSLSQTLPHDHLAICVYDESAGKLLDYAATSTVKKRICPANGMPLEDSLTGQVFLEGKSRVFNHADLVHVPFSVTRRALAAGIVSSCFVPLLAAKGRVGVLTLSSHQDNAFRQEDLEFLEQVAAALAQALQNSLAHKALQEEKKRLQVLLNVSAALAANRSVQEAFSKISAYLRRVLRQEFAAFVLLDEKSGLLVRQALDFPLGKGLCAAVKVMTADGPAGRALRERTSHIFSKEEMKAFPGDSTRHFLAEGIQSLCCVPLIRPKTVLGVLVMGSTRADAFKPDDLVLLNQVAQLAVALETHRVSLEVEALKARLSAERKYLEGEIHTEHNFEEIVGQSPALKQTLKQVETVAGSDATVLILGDTGTGKELVARAIHGISKRKDRSFIKLNCAAIPTGLLESELFGHEKGAFTGAVSRKIGRLELADQGTLFLDEVGEIPPELQPKLLRVLQDHEFERLGGTKTIKVDLRLIAATNRDLSKSVQDNEFRGDLFYRLNVFPIRMPSLRERRADIPLLVRHFVRKFARRLDRNIETIPTETMNALINWDWPGNVRELENFIERSIILSEGAALLAPLGELKTDSRGSGSTPSTLENAEREHILRVLRESGGVISGPTGAAHRLGVKRSTLQSKMDRLGIHRKDYSSQPPA
ncbi:MAG: sigma 54-interacting transcriptional regulator [Candidatus Sulfotelmatobacter sp.]